MSNILRIIKKFIPKSVFHFFQPAYHFCLALLGAIIYRFPGRRITVIGITGTKGKTSSAEILNSMFEAAGKKTALAGTLRMKIGNNSKRNMYKMTLPGRFFVQSFLRKAVDAKCDVVILELTSEGARQFRHKFLSLNALLFLNISPEHIESHGGFDNYLAAKLSIAKEVERSTKEKRVIVSNSDDVHGKDFLDFDVPTKVPYSITDAQSITFDENGTHFMFQGETVNTKLIGRFNVYNFIGCAFVADHFGVTLPEIIDGVESIKKIRGRGQKITLEDSHPNKDKQDFTAIVDYAHTTSSLEAIYGAFEYDRKICVLGNTGGGRDTWKRPEMGKIADTHCSHIILTDEDPYDEDPMKIINDMEKAISINNAEIILNRREAIERAIDIAKKDDVVIITGKGTDPYIMGPNGTKTPWSDSEVTRDAIEKKLKAKS